MNIEILATLLSAGKYSAVFILLYLLHYMYVQRLRESFGVGACRGNPDKCVYNMAISQANMIRSRYDNLIHTINKDFARSLQDAIRDKDIVATSLQIRDAIACHKHLLWYSFLPAIEETKRILRENHIPREQLAFDNFVDEKNNHISALMWQRFRDGYSSHIMLIPYSKREERQNKNAHIYREFARDILATGMAISDKGGV